MASIFGDDGVDDLFNDNFGVDGDRLPSDGEQAAEEGLFGEGEVGADNAEQAIKLATKKQRTVRNPRPRLTVDTLCGQRGIHTIEEYFKDIKFRGKGHEKHDLDEVMRRLQHWGHRMYPTYKFDDILTNIERLGKKKTLQVHMSRYRLGMLENFKLNVANELADADDDANDNAANEEPYDEFDALLGEQIAISKLDPRTPASANRYNSSNSRYGSGTNTSHTTIQATPSFSHNAVMSTPYATGGKAINLNDTSDYAQPLPPSQPATPTAKKISTEQMARIAENRRLAQERLKAKQEAAKQQATNGSGLEI